MKVLLSTSLLAIIIATGLSPLSGNAKPFMVSGESRIAPIMNNGGTPTVTPRKPSAQRIKKFKTEIALINTEIAKVQKKLDAANMKGSNLVIAIYQKKLAALATALASKQGVLDSLEK